MIALQIQLFGRQELFPSGIGRVSWLFEEPGCRIVRLVATVLNERHWIGVLLQVGIDFKDTRIWQLGQQLTKQKK